MAPPGDSRTTAFPDVVDLRQSLWPVENCGNMVSPAAAAATALEYHCYRMGEPATNLSTLFIDYNARRVSGNQDKRVGTKMEWVMEGIRTYGACRETTWPFDPEKATTSPPAQAYEEAKKFAGVRTANPTNVVEALALTYPVPFITWVPTRLLDEAGRTGVMPPMTDTERQRFTDHPGHSMVLVGYDQATKTYLVRNCYGEQWGDRGYCRIPFDVFGSLMVSGRSTTWFIGKAEVVKTDGVATGAPQAAAAVSGLVATAGGAAEVATTAVRESPIRPTRMAPPTDIRTTAVPDKIDLREYLWPVENIGNTFASCAAAAATALEYHSNRIGEPPTNLSRLFIHYNARRLSGDQDKDTGTTMDAAMKAIAEHGACPEATWPFDPAQLTKAPPAQAYQEAKKFAGVRCLHPTDFVEAVGLTYPVPFIARIPSRCLNEAGRTQVLPPLTAEEQQHIKEHPGYALVIVGYDKADKTYLVRNCWGDRWGDRGHCRIPFDLFHSLVPPGSNNAWFVAKADATVGASRLRSLLRLLP